jgi:SAM-dependent methyltransferase
LAEAPAVIDHDNLEEFTDPENYDRECGAIGEEGAFFLDLVRRSGGPVLDIGCGTGRLAIPLAHEGFAVTGVDLSENMLAQACTKSADLAIDWVRGDMREMALARRYRSAFMAGHAFQAMLTDGEQRALFDGVARHLEPGGLFAFTSRNPRDRDLYGNEAETFWHSFTDTRGRRVDVSTAEIYDSDGAILHVTSWRRVHGRDDIPPRLSRIALRYTSPADLAHRLAASGFVVDSIIGDWDGSPVGPNSPEIIVTVRLGA